MYPPFKKRVYAFLLDYILIVIYGVFVVGTLSLVFRPYISPLFSVSPVTAEWTGFFMMTLPVSLYFILTERSNLQGSWGKKKLGLCVVNTEGERISLWQSIIRTVVKFLPWEISHFCIWRLMLPTDFSEMTIIILLNVVNLAILTYLLFPFTNKMRKNIYDLAAVTVVIHCIADFNGGKTNE